MTSRTSLSLVLSALLAGLTVASNAAGIATIKLRVSRSAILNDGRDVSEIIADVRDSTGNFVPNGASVRFEAQGGGGFQPGMVPNATATTQSGQARVRFAGQQKGTAKIFASMQGAVSEPVEVILTDDATETFQGNAYIDLGGTKSLLYSANERVLEATGKQRAEGDQGLPGAILTYRNIEIVADTIQVSCTDNVVRAIGHVRISRSGKRLQCLKLNFPLLGKDGVAMVETDKRIQPVKVKAVDLSTTPLTEGIAAPVFQLADIGSAPQLIEATQVRLFPGEKLQFKRPKFYTDGQKLVAMPFYSLPLYSTQLFTDQFVSVGSQGLGVDVPLYYDLSAGSTGIFHVRHGERGGRSSFATRPGWSLDMIQQYNSSGTARRYTGELGLTGLSRTDWGFRWNHSQEFNADTRGSVNFDLPQHRAAFLSTNLNRDFGPLHLGLNMSANRALSGYRASGSELDGFLETTPTKVGKTGYRMAYGITAMSASNKNEGFSNSLASQGVQARFYSKPFTLGRSTSVTNYFTVGNAWTDRGRSGPSLLSTVTASHTFSGGANLQMTYDFAQTPATLIDSGKHRLSTTFAMSGGSKWNLFVYNSMFLDASISSTITDFNFAIAPRWRMTLSATLQQFAGSQFRDYQLGFARSIGGRDFVLSYSTFSHRFFFDLEASRF
jgi:hypothetical protein